MPKRPKYEAWHPDDDPKVGDIWRREEFGPDGSSSWQYYLLMDGYRSIVFEGYWFTALWLNRGEEVPISFNFEVDEWRQHI